MKMQKATLLRSVLVFILSMFCACGGGGGKGGGKAGGGGNTTYSINIDGMYAVSVIPPGIFNPVVDYAGINAVRAFSDVEVGASLNAAHDTLTIEITDTGGHPIKRLWAIAVESTNAELDNPDSVNKLGQPVFVFGPYATTGSVSRDIQIKITAVPATIQLDLLEVNDRIAYSSSKGYVLEQRIWTIDQDGTQPYLVESGDTGDLVQTTPIWSPGMEWVAYGEVYMGNSEIYIMHPDGGSWRLVSPSGEWSEQPSFPPSGKNLV
jgi:hypothetical protein